MIARIYKMYKKIQLSLLIGLLPTPYPLLSTPDHTAFHQEEIAEETEFNLLTEDEFDKTTTSEKKDPETKNKDQQSEEDELPITPRTINDIIISGNKYISDEAILNKIPYQIGEIFNPQKTGQLIRNLYYNLGRFRTISVMGENIGNDKINIHIIVKEKKILKDVVFEGNAHISTKDIKAKVNFDDVPAVDEEELKRFAVAIKKVYLDKGYNLAEVRPELIVDGDQAIAKFVIEENKKSRVKRILFKGNKNISGKDLRSNIFTREDWVLGFLDNSGNYHPERLEADKHIIEQYYQNHGYLNAKVIDIDIDMDDQTKQITLTFEIEEGNQYTIKDVRAPGNDILSEEVLLSRLPVRPGRVYSRESIVESIKRLELLWGEHGYIFAHIEPAIQPDDQTNTVSLAFYTELGSPVRLNKITIRGNRKTRDKIIRRKINLEEGELITNSKMESSKNRIEGLGYFDPRDGVNWKITRLAGDLADLDIIVNETKTGHAHLKFGFGGAGADLGSPTSGLSVGGEIADTNLFGRGINLNVQTSWAREESTIAIHLAEPWLFDRPILGAMDIYHRRPSYDEFRYVSTINEKRTGGSLTAGFVKRSQIFADDVQIVFSLGADSMKYEELPKARINGTGDDATANKEFQDILTKLFTSGEFVWLNNVIEQDRRNHPIHPSRGHRWALQSKFALPTFSKALSFYKITLDANWYTPLIGEHDLVLRLRSFFGVAAPFKKRLIPFGELFNIGGPGSVRGFLFGQIGPKFLGDPIGAKKAIFFSAELQFPITPDFNMKGVVFYDGGAGWDTAYASCISGKRLTGNSFDYRHSVGAGIRMMNPMPVTIDWGFKLDPRKNKLDPSKSESASEVHFGMTYDW